MNARARRVLLGVALLASLAATRWVASQDTPALEKPGDPAVKRERAAPAQRQSAASASPPAQAEDLPVDKLKRPRAGSSSDDLFPTSTWEPPPPRLSSKVAAPPAPVAPALPFSYFGKMSEEGHTTVFLNGANRSYAARVGDVLDGQYKVEDIRDAGVVLTYLPLKQQQILNIGN